MAMPAYILSLNLGSQSVGLAAFRGQAAGGLVLHGFRMREILADPASESARNAQITSALRDMLDELQIEKGKVSYAVASQSVFARFVKLPSVDEEKIERIISLRSATERAIPDQRSGVGLPARRRRHGRTNPSRAGRHQSPTCSKGSTPRLKMRGLEPSLVDVATMALYNAFRYNYERVERLFAPGRHRRAHDQSAFHRTRENFQPQYSNRRQLHFLRDREGNERTIGGGGVSEETRRIR